MDDRELRDIGGHELLCDPQSTLVSAFVSGYRLAERTEIADMRSRAEKAEAEVERLINAEHERDVAVETSKAILSDLGDHLEPFCDEMMRCKLNAAESHLSAIDALHKAEVLTYERRIATMLNEASAMEARIADLEDRERDTLERNSFKAEADRLGWNLNFLTTAGDEDGGWCEHERRYQRTAGGDGDWCYLCELAEVKQELEQAQADAEKAEAEASEWQEIAGFIACERAKDLLLDMDAVDEIIEAARGAVHLTSAALAEKE